MRPLLIDGRTDDLRAALRGTHSAQWQRLYEECERYRGMTPPPEHPTASITYFGPYSANLALAYRLTGQRWYLEEAWRWMSTCVRYPHWGKANLPDHDLDAGWLLHGLSLAYTWLGADLEPERAKELRAKLELQGGRLYDYAVSTEGRWWSSSYWQNHNWICYTGLATAGYALDVPEWTERARDNFAIVLELLARDGSDAEGVVYWRYGVPWLAIYLDLLERTEGTSWWDRGSFLRNTFGWRLHQCAPGFAENLDHGDCHDRRSGHSVALYYKLAAQYGIGEAQWLANMVSRKHFWREAYESGVRPGVLPEAFYELLWYDPTVPPVEPAAATPTVAYFPDLGQVTARTGWGPAATLLSFKAAPGGGHGAWQTAQRIRSDSGWDTLNAGHHHPDAGSFVLVSHGAFLAVDDGYCNSKRAGNHNTVLVDGHGWDGEGRYNVYGGLPFGRQPRLRDVLAEQGFAHATAETARMYAADLGVRRCDRTLVVTPSGRVVVLDVLAATGAREWTVLVHADHPPEPADDATHTLRSGSGLAWVRRLAPLRLTVDTTVTEIEANPTSSTPSLRITKTLHTLRSRTERTANAVVLTTLEPTDGLAPEPATAELVDCVHGYGVRFGQDELVLLSPLHHRIEGAGVRADAAAVVLAGTRLAAVTAREVTWQDHPVLTGEDTVTQILEVPR
jgi:heparinase II/III-like protein